MVRKDYRLSGEDIIDCFQNPETGVFMFQKDFERQSYKKRTSQLEKSSSEDNGCGCSCCIGCGCLSVIGGLTILYGLYKLIF